MRTLEGDGISFFADLKLFASSLPLLAQRVEPAKSRRQLHKRIGHCHCLSRVVHRKPDILDYQMVRSTLDDDCINGGRSYRDLTVRAQRDQDECESKPGIGVHRLIP